MAILRVRRIFVARTATIDHQPARIPQGPVQSLLFKCHGECGEQRDQEDRVHELNYGRGLAQWTFLDM
jgi:hypothetical protein